MITQCIHQTGPWDRQRWHTLWSTCSESWRRNFPSWRYRFWDDQDLADLVRDHYSNYWQFYQDLPLQIMRVDFARFCVLHRFGGVYADLDVYCYADFSREIPLGVNVMGTMPGHNYHDIVENSLMISCPGHDFWLRCMNLSQTRYKKYLANYRYSLNGDHDLLNHIPLMVSYVTGSNLLAAVTREYSRDVGILSAHLYNNDAWCYSRDFRTKHMLTQSWLHRDPTTMNRRYPENFDFHRDYTQGRCLGDHDRREWDLDINDIQDGLSPCTLHYH